MTLRAPLKFAMFLYSRYVNKSQETGTAAKFRVRKGDMCVNVPLQGPWATFQPLLGLGPSTVSPIVIMRTRMHLCSCEFPFQNCVSSEKKNCYSTLVLISSRDWKVATLPGAIISHRSADCALVVTSTLNTNPGSFAELGLVTARIVAP